MSDMKIILPGPETITLAGYTIDKLIRAGDGDAALLYLYILKTSGQSTSDEAAAAMGKSAGWIASAMAVLSRIGLVQYDENAGGDSQGTPAQPHSKTASKAPHKTPDDYQDGYQDGYPEDDSMDDPVIGQRRYTIEEIKNELKAGSGFASVVEETQRWLGRILNPDELLRLFGIYDSLRLPPEVILQLITHCINESRKSGGGRAPSMRYIEKAAYTWEREGIFTLERAEEYLKELEVQKSARGELRDALQIKNREFSETEKRYVDDWIAKGFGPDAVAIAYDRTVVKTGNMSWGYMDKIMASWHGKGIHTPQEILEKDGKPHRNAARKIEPPDKKFGASDQDEIERIQKFREMIKNKESNK